MIRRFVTMTEAVDVKAGIKHILERIEVVSKARPDQVNASNVNLEILSDSIYFSSKVRFSLLL